MESSALDLAIPVSARAWFWGVVLTLLVPLTLLTVSLLPARTAILHQYLPVAVGAYVLVVGVAIWLLSSMATASIRVGNDSVTIRSGFFRSSVPLSSIEKSSIRVLGPSSSPELASRVNGIGLPGFLAGWFHDTARRKVFVAYGGGSWVSFSTREGQNYICGTGDADALVRAIGR